jgi:hypothetical protein
MKRFVEVTVGWPGSVGDGRVFANSFLKGNLEQFLSRLPSVPVATKATASSQTLHEDVPAFILGDSAYPSTCRVVPTFKNTECNQCPLTRKLNAKLALCRYHVENAFGICKGQFTLLNRSLKCSKEDVVRASFLITAIFTVHNFLIDENDATEFDVPDHIEGGVINDGAPNGESYYLTEEEEGATKTRDVLLRHMRCLVAEIGR